MQILGRKANAGWPALLKQQATKGRGCFQPRSDFRLGLLVGLQKAVTTPPKAHQTPRLPRYLGIIGPSKPRVGDGRRASSVARLPLFASEWALTGTKSGADSYRCSVLDVGNSLLNSSTALNNMLAEIMFSL